MENVQSINRIGSETVKYHEDTLNVIINKHGFTDCKTSSTCVRRLDGAFFAAENWTYMPYIGTLQFEKLESPNVDIVKANFFKGMPAWQGKSMLRIPLTDFGHMSIICIGDPDPNYSVQGKSVKSKLLNAVQKQVIDYLRDCIKKLKVNSPSRRNLRYNAGSKEPIRIYSESDYNEVGEQMNSSRLQNVFQKLKLFCFAGGKCDEVLYFSWYLRKNADVPEELTENWCCSNLWHVKIQNCRFAGLHVDFDWETRMDENESFRFFHSAVAAEKFKNNESVTIRQYQVGMLPLSMAGNLAVTYKQAPLNGVTGFKMYKRTCSEIKENPHFCGNHITDCAKRKLEEVIKHFLELEKSVICLKQRKLKMLDFGNLDRIFKILNLQWTQDNICRVEVFLCFQQPKFSCLKDFTATCFETAEKYLLTHGIENPKLCTVSSKGVKELSLRVLTLCQNTLQDYVERVNHLLTNPELISLSSLVEFQSNHNCAAVIAETLLGKFLRGNFKPTSLAGKTLTEKGTLESLSLGKIREDLEGVRIIILSSKFVEESPILKIKVQQEFLAQLTKDIPAEKSRLQLLEVRHMWIQLVTSIEQEDTQNLQSLLLDRLTSTIVNFVFLSPQFQGFKEQYAGLKESFATSNNFVLQVMSGYELFRRLMDGKSPFTTQRCGIYLAQHFQSVIEKLAAVNVQNRLRNLTVEMFHTSVLDVILMLMMKHQIPLAWCKNDKRPQNVSSKGSKSRKDTSGCCMYLAVPSLSVVSLDTQIECKRIQELSSIFVNAALFQFSVPVPDDAKVKCISWLNDIIAQLLKSSLISDKYIKAVIQCLVSHKLKMLLFGTSALTQSEFKIAVALSASDLSDSEVNDLCFCLYK